MSPFIRFSQGHPRAMEPGTSKNSAPVDEPLNEEVLGAEPRAEVKKSIEPPGDDLPRTDGVSQLSHVGRYIGLSALPGDRNALIRSADVLLAPDDLLADLRRLPEGAVYHTVREVWSALGHGAPKPARAGAAEAQDVTE
jgi:hypothetical protein